ncbi:TPA: tetratricopeptide repeat protein [Candidatus Woesearchaeota archaeon]|nr:tetratricopeptide repeat protein [Candidatus Woesearchaeota archaeon]
MHKIAAMVAVFIALAGSALAVGVLVGPFESQEQMLPIQHDPVFYNNLGYELAQQGDLLGAQAAFERAVELRPGYEKARSNLATIAFQRGEYATATSQLRWLVAQYPDNQNYQFDLAQNLVSQARYVDADLAKLEEGAAIYESLGSFPNAASNAAIVRAVIADVTA